MTNDSANFDLSFDADLDEFDPLEDTEEETEDEGQPDEFMAAVGSALDAPDQADEEPAPAADTRSAEERTADLLASMAPRRKVLLGILAACVEPAPVADVNALVDELQSNNFSVYSAANLCSLLEKAGAIERVTADGQPADEVEVEPKTVVVDGVEYLEPGDPIETFWSITDAGRGALEADKPLERLQNLLEEDARYAVIYKRILTMCEAEGGATTPIINGAVDGDPLVQKPRRYAPHFIDKLEKCDALTWKQGWVTTEVGKAGLELLADVEDAAADEAADEAADNEEN